MRIALSGVAVLALAAASISAAFGQTSSDVAMKGCTMPMGSTMMPHCTPASGPVVWYVAASKKYYLKGSATYGKGKGMYVCRAVAVARGGKPGASAMGGGSMGHGAMGHGAMGTETHGSMTGAPMTMAPRPMSSGSSTMTSPGSGTMASPVPSTSPGAMTNASGNQRNTGAPGAGGQVPNNPASTPNGSPRPNASPSMRP